jgi:hypothetical protein
MAAAARFRGVSRAAIADLVRRGRLHSCKIGDRTLVNKGEVLVFQPKSIGRPRKTALKKSAKKRVKNAPK